MAKMAYNSEKKKAFSGPWHFLKLDKLPSSPRTSSTRNQILESFPYKSGQSSKYSSKFSSFLSIQKQIQLISWKKCSTTKAITWLDSPEGSISHLCLIYSPHHSIPSFWVHIHRFSKRHGYNLVDGYLDSFQALVFDTGYANPQTLVVKFWQGLQIGIQNYTERIQINLSLFLLQSLLFTTRDSI